MGQKQCSKCFEVKPLVDFHKDTAAHADKSRSRSHVTQSVSR